MADSPWSLLQSGPNANALASLRADFERDPDSSHIMELGVAYLWTRDYPAAFEHFQSACEKYPNSISTFYGMAGVAKWCLNEAVPAQEYWINGLDCNYSDSGGAAVELPLLLYMSSIVHGNTSEEKWILQKLTDKQSDIRCRNWPKPLLDYLLGDLDKKEIFRNVKSVNEHHSRFYSWYANFYIGVNEYKNGNHSLFRQLMQQTAATTEEDFDPNSKSFLSKLWNEIIYIARHFLDNN